MRLLLACLFLLSALVWPAAALAVPADLSPDHGESLRGEVTIDVYRGRGIAVAVDTNTPDQLPDGIIDRVFLLEMFGRVPRELPIVLRNAKVALRNEAAFVVDLEGPTVVTLWVEEQFPEDRLLGLIDLHAGARELGENDVRYRYSGFGLMRATGEWLLPMTNWFGEDLPGNTEQTSCEAGGPGARGCSYGGCARGTSCSITSCDTGTYACCGCSSRGRGPAVCYCRLDDPDNGGGGGGGTGGGSGGCENDGSGCPAECIRCTGSGPPIPVQG